MTNSSIYAAFERMWEHTVNKFNNYVPTKVFDDHASNIDNPHEITAEQVGAYTREQVDAKVESIETYLDIDENGVLYLNMNLFATAEEREW